MIRPKPVSGLPEISIVVGMARLGFSDHEIALRTRNMLSEVVSEVAAVDEGDAVAIFRARYKRYLREIEPAKFTRGPKV